MELVKTVLKVTTQKSISIKNEFESFQRRLDRMKNFILGNSKKMAFLVLIKNRFKY